MKRVIDTRWTGHLQATKSTRANYHEICAALDQATDADSVLHGEDIAMATETSNIMKQK